jgi:hypothetical protein
MRVADLARGMVDGTLTQAAGIEIMAAEYDQRGGDPELTEAYRDRFGRRLDVIAERIRDGIELTPIAIIRPDINPAIVVGLSIDPDVPLSRSTVCWRAGARTARRSGQTVFRRQAKGGRLENRRLRANLADRQLRLCPTPDKSVSVAHAFASPAEKALIHAHIEAARDAVGYIAAKVGHVRLGRGGTVGREAGHVAWLEFTHYTTRRTLIMAADGITGFKTDTTLAGDPNLHTHCLILNAVFTKSGRVGLLDTAAVPGLIREAAGLYHAALASSLRAAGFNTCSICAPVLRA